MNLACGVLNKRSEISDVTLVRFCAEMPRIGVRVHAFCVSGALPQPEPVKGFWKVQDPRSALAGLLHPMSSMGLLTRFLFPENIYVICFFLKDLAPKF